jgi:hypothetical protein
VITNSTRAHEDIKVDRRKQDVLDTLMQAEVDGGYQTMVVRNPAFERRERERKRRRRERIVP